MHPQIIIRGYRSALNIALEQISHLTHTFSSEKPEQKRDMLLKCASTALNSKLLSGYKGYFSELVVSAVETLDTTLLDKDLIGIK
jgi:T-complex protein 1 subunit eta